MNKFNIALAGNPNSGKTTLFNALTGSKQRVGNWPGVTVERLEGKYKYKEYNFNVIDLPGIYSFSAYSLDEKVAREYILVDKPDLVVNIIDATNLERNLYLTTQLLEMKIPVVVALNMTDLLKDRNIRIEVEHLATHLDCPVVSIVASKKVGIDSLREQILISAKNQHISGTKVTYDSVVEEALAQLIPIVQHFSEGKKVDNRWLAIKLLEGDQLADKISEHKFKKIIGQDIQRIEKHTGINIEIVIADGRYGFIHGLSRDVIHKEAEFRKNLSDFIDKFVLNRFLSVPIFFGVMYLVFTLTIKIGSPFIDFFDKVSGAIFVDGFSSLLNTIGSPSWLIIILAKGVGSGIQTVSTFIPPVFFMFLSLAILEDSGYMSRAAFVMDRFMRLIGLPGKAFIPMMIGFGCNVPAILATRTLDNKKDRILTILINPLMSCGARLPVYALFAAIFFPQNGGTVIFSLYAIGILLAILSGLLFKRTLFKGDTSTFVMELPPYHLPTFNGIMMHTWQRLKGFILRAGQVIIIFIILLNILSSIGVDGSIGTENFDKSVLSYLGKAITPIFKPMGIQKENWPATVGLVTGIFAKETVVSTLKSLYTQAEEAQVEVEGLGENLYSALKDLFKSILRSETGEQIGNPQFNRAMHSRFETRNSAFAYLLFVLIYMPCVGVIAVIFKEIGLKWTIFSLTYLTSLAWIISTLFFQLSNIGNNPKSSFLWIILCFIMLGIIYLGLKIMGGSKIIKKGELG